MTVSYDNPPFNDGSGSDWPWSKTQLQIPDYFFGSDLVPSCRPEIRCSSEGKPGYRTFAADSREMACPAAWFAGCARTNRREAGHSSSTGMCCLPVQEFHHYP